MVSGGNYLLNNLSRKEIFTIVPLLMLSFLYTLLISKKLITTIFAYPQPINPDGEGEKEKEFNEERSVIVKVKATLSLREWR